MKQTLSKQSYADLDIVNRKEKAVKILKVLFDFGVKKGDNLLEIGTGSGIISNELSMFFKVNSVDVVDERVIKDGYKFKIVKDTNLSFVNNHFDVIVSNQVIEHVDDYINHLKEIFRCLKKGGICYLATPNKFAVFEAHYRLPFLSWLPKRWADFYLKLFFKKKYDVFPLSYLYLIKLCKSTGFETNHISLSVLRNPVKFGLDNKYFKFSRLINLFPIKLDWLISFILPSWIFILRKN